jgi:hypothetical protein
MFWKKKPKMHKTKLTSVGCDVPDDFPSEWHEETKQLLVKYKDTKLTEWKSFSVGWNGIVYRYRAMTEYDEIFTTSISKIGSSPPPEERYHQDKALFGFFVNAVSVIECFFYAVFWIGIIIKPSLSPMDAKSLQSLYPKDISKKYEKEFPRENLTKKLRAFIGCPQYTDMKDMRDVLSHRGKLPRNYYAGGERDGKTTMPNNPKESTSKWVLNNYIDKETTAKRRKFLSTELESLTSETVKFCKLLP